MQATAAEHPQKEQLSAFALGKLESAQVEAVESHLASCETCCETLKQIQEDTFVGLVRESRKLDAAPRAEPGTLADGNPADAATVPPATTDQESSDVSRTQASPPDRGQPTDLPADMANHPRYRIVELLGSGGMGAVYKAEHRMMQRTVALKVINSNLVASKSAVERFRREVQAAARLHHPNIVTAHDAEQAGDAHFLVMEFVPGTDLHKVLEERGPLPVAEACEYLRQAALGLQHAYESGMVHRDIKPQNLMLSVVRSQSSVAKESKTTANGPQTTDYGRIQILDFGLASLASEASAPDSADLESTTANQKSGITQAGALMGTPDYMAPEQARDAHTADIRADIYSLGCTLYCLLTGKVPFPGGSAIDKVICHSERKPQPVNETRKDIPPALMKVLDKMMAKAPADRYQTPAEVAAALVPFAIEDLRQLAAAVERTVRAPADALILAASLALVFAVVVGLWIWFQGTTVSQPAETTLTVMSLANLFYALLVGGCGWLLRIRRARLASLLCVALVGIAFPGMYALNALMEWGRVPQWPVLIPQWLGLPLCIWGTVELFRRDARAGSAESKARTPLTRRLLIGTAVIGAPLLVGGIIYVATDNGRLEIDCKVDDVQVVVSKGGKQYEVIDLKSGSTVKRLPSGEYQITLKGDHTDVKLNRGEFTMTRWGQVIVTVTKEAPVADLKKLAFEALERELSLVVRAGRSQLSEKERQELLVHSHPLWGQLADPPTKKIIELFANLPDGAHQHLLKEGYLKWKLPSLDAARQKVYRDALKLNIDLAKKQGVEVPPTMSLEALEKADVGFAVVKLPPPAQPVVSWYILLPEHPAPIWMTVVGVKEAGKQPYFDAHNQQLSALRAKPYSTSIEELGVTPRSVEDLLQGEWRPVLVEQNGQPIPAEFLKKRDFPTQFIFQGNLWGAVTASGQKYSSSFKIYPDKKPISMDVSGALFEKMPSIYGILKIEGDTATMCVAERPELRPTDFTSKGQRMLIVVRRVSQAAENRLKALLARESDPKTDRDQLRAEVVEFRWRYPGLPHSIQAAEMLGRLPSPPDRLDRTQIAPPLRDEKLKEPVAAFKAHQGAVTSVAFTPDGKLLSCCGQDKIIRLWDLSGKEPVEAATFQGHTGTIWSIVCSPDGKWLATSSEDKTVRLWDLTQKGAKEPLVIAGYTYSITGLAFSPDGKTLATASWDGKRQGYVRLLELGGPAVWKERVVITGHTGLVQGVSFAPDGRTLASGALDGTVRVWDLTGAQPRQRAMLRHPDWVYPVAFSPDGSALRSVCKDGLQRIWDASKEIPELRMELKAGATTYSPDGRALISWDSGGKLLLWDAKLPRQSGFAGLAKAKQLAEWKLTNVTAVTSIAFAPDSRHVALGSPNGLISIVRLAGPQHPIAAQAKSDKELIQGAWKAVAAEVSGQAVPPEMMELMKPTITFTAEQVTAKPNAPFPKQFLETAAGKGLLPKDLAAILEKGLEGVYDLDPAKSPKTINISYLGPVRKTMLGIYSLDGDTLKLCMTVDPDRVDDRPKEFATKAGVLRGMVILKRALGAELPDSPRGTFTIKGGDGAAWELTLDGTSKFQVIRNGQLAVEGSYKITKDEIAFTDEAGPQREQGNAKTGTHRWRLAGSKLLFTVVNDQARGRSTMLTSGAWDVKDSRKSDQK